ncbi:MAG: single-stranded DNA-binding protein, partial [Pedobacter sp.]
ADEAALLIKKGTRLSIEGRLSAQQYEAKDGTKRYTTEIIVNELKVLNQSTDQQEQES